MSWWQVVTVCQANISVCWETGIDRMHLITVSNCWTMGTYYQISTEISSLAVHEQKLEKQIWWLTMTSYSTHQGVCWCWGHYSPRFSNWTMARCIYSHFSLDFDPTLFDSNYVNPVFTVFNFYCVREKLQDSWRSEESSEDFLAPTRAQGVGICVSLFSRAVLTCPELLIFLFPPRLGLS